MARESILTFTIENFDVYIGYDVHIRTCYINCFEISLVLLRDTVQLT